MASLSLFRQPSSSSLLSSLARAFSTTRPACARSSKDRLALDHSEVPPYPYGPSLIYRQSNFGLYGTAKIRFGNSVSEKNEIKNRRKWKPNVQRKFLRSDALNEEIQVRLTASVLRTIEKVGGLDNYLLGDKAARIKELGMEGWRLRWKIMQTRAVRQRYRLEREKLGLPPSKTPLVLPDGTVTTQEKVDEEFELERKAELKRKAVIKRAARKKELAARAAEKKRALMEEDTRRWKRVELE